MQQDDNRVEDYDLDGVTAILQAMEAKRKQYRSRRCNNELMAMASEFELGPADLSSGGSDESDDGQQSNSSIPSDEDNAVRGRPVKHQRERQSARKLRAKDSLDLSMSVSMSGEPFESTIRPESGKPYSKLQLVDSKVTKEPAVIWPKVLSPNERHCYDKQREQRNHNGARMQSRIPKLVQQHRQMKAAPKVASTGKCVQLEASQRGRSSRQDGVVSEIHDSLSAGAGALFEHPPPHLSKPNVRYKRAVNEKSMTQKSLLQVQKSSYTGWAHVGTRVSERNSPKHSAAPLKVANSPVHESHAEHTQAEVNKPTASRYKFHPVHDVSEEIEVATAEETKLLQSLEKLDQRLSNVSAPPPPAVREGIERNFHRDAPLKIDRRMDYSTGGHCSAYTEIDDEMLRAAAYGGGTHCKLRQLSSATVRSSLLKREEISGGVHKARVRIGGAFAKGSSGRSNTDRSGKHNVVVKKELAHLLF